MNCFQEKRRREQEKNELSESRKKARNSKIGSLGIVDGDGNKEGYEEVPINYSVENCTFGDDEEGAEKEYKPETPEELAEVSLN